jgi:HEAT repeat protein
LLQLQQKKPAKPNREVAQALEALTISDNASARHLATKALVNWATPESADALLKLLDDKSPIVRGPAMAALGKLKHKEAIPLIAARLGSLQDRVQARGVLLAIGSDAEGEVRKQLESAEWQTRYEACKILKTIGTKESAPALEKLLNDPQPLVKQTA